MKKFRFALFLAASALWVSAAGALEVPEKPDSRVNDYAGMLSAGARGQLEKTLSDFEKETSSQAVVATFRSLEGDSLEDFSIRLAEKWKIGTREKDNGVLLIVFKEDREVRIEVGYGLEGALPDALAKRIIENELVPAFKQGDFDTGVLKGVGAILLATKGEYTAGSPAADPMEEAAPLIFLAMLLYAFLPVFCYFLIFGGAVAVYGLPGAVAAAVLIAVLEMVRRLLAAEVLGNTLSGRSGRGSFGGWSGGGFGGGFSGGGGSFGGGGASGRW